MYVTQYYNRISHFCVLDNDYLYTVIYYIILFILPLHNNFEWIFSYNIKFVVC